MNALWARPFLSLRTWLSPSTTQVQASRIGRTSITFFVKEGAKPMIRAALADGGYGTSYQEGLVNMLNELLESQNRQRVA